MSFRLNVTKKAYNRFLNKDFSCTPYYLFFFRMSVLKSQYLLYLLKSVTICLSDTYINMCQLCNAMFHPLGQVFFKSEGIVFFTFP